MAGNLYTGKLEKIMERMRKMGNADIYGKIMEKAAMLNDCDGMCMSACREIQTYWPLQ